MDGSVTEGMALLETFDLLNICGPLILDVIELIMDLTICGHFGPRPAGESMVAAGKFSGTPVPRGNERRESVFVVP